MEEDDNFNFVIRNEIYFWKIYGNVLMNYLFICRGFLGLKKWYKMDDVFYM